MNTTNEEKRATKDLLNKCRTFLNDNFHKFSQTNKIKIALALIQKSMPTQLEGELTHNHFFETLITKSMPSRLESYAHKN